MNRYKIISIISLAFITATATLSCKNDNKSKTNIPVENKNESNQGIKIVFINIDSMQNLLDFFNTKKEEFAKEEQAIQNELIGIQRNLQNTASNLEKRIKSGDISDVEIENTQRKLANLQNSLGQKQETLTMALMKKQAEFNNTLMNMLEAFTLEYNKEHQYDVILTNSAAVYYNQQLNITADFSPKFNDWINAKLKDQAIMKTFQEMNKNKSTENADSTKKD